MMKIIATLGVVAVLLAAAACGPGSAGSGGGAAAETGKEIKSGKVGSLTVIISNEEGVLKQGDEEFFVTFKDAAGKPVDVGAASLNFYMPAMGTMPVMNDPATLTTTATPGVYSAKAKIEMAGEWQAQVAYEGSAGSGKGSFPVTAQH
ncbi:MAG TPA: FixH family protein [Pyrinomonadaceae bacterium]|nr:FixH family protein [Pyrinomonadaceae bacterium]